MTHKQLLLILSLLTFFACVNLSAGVATLLANPTSTTTDENKSKNTGTDNPSTQCAENVDELYFEIEEVTKKYIQEDDINTHFALYIHHQKSISARLSILMTKQLFKHIFIHHHTHKDKTFLINLANSIINNAGNKNSVLLVAAKLFKIEYFIEYPALNTDNISLLGVLVEVEKLLATDFFEDSYFLILLCKAKHAFLAGHLLLKREQKLAKSYFWKARILLATLLRQKNLTATDVTIFKSMLKNVRDHTKKIDSASIFIQTPENSDVYFDIHLKKVTEGFYGNSDKDYRSFAYQLVNHPKATQEQEAMGLLYIAEYALRHNDKKNAYLYAEFVLSSESYSDTWKEYAEDIVSALGHEIKTDETEMWSTSNSN